MTKVADLHVHTYLSDGTFSPLKVVEYSKAKGLDAIAITDHDCVAGITPAIRAGKSIGLEVIPGVELTAELEEAEIHILGYFIDWQDRSFVEKLDEISNVRRERAKKILKKLKEHKVNIPEEELFEFSGPGSVGRLHIANLLLKKGFVSSLSEAFSRYIGDKGCCYVKKFKLSPAEAVEMIKKVGGIPVLAHPKTINIEGKTIEDILKELVRDGIKGVEVYHSDHSPKDENELKALADEYHLLVTGGSDCHGFGKKEVLIGKVKISYELVEKLKEVSMSR
jgi:predicted metal-dependent phosphoesterase TrpH